MSFSLVAKNDFKAVLVIGVLVGLLIQPVLANVLPQATFGWRLAAFVGFIILAPLALWIASILGRLWPVLYQFAKFAAVGVLNTMIDFGVLNFEIYIFGVYAGAAYTAFKAISFLCGTTNSFFWNKLWTFGAKEGATAGEALKFYVVAGVGWLLNVSAASLVVNGIARPLSITPARWDNIGALAGVAASFLWDFLGYKFLVFKKKPDNQPLAE